MDEAFIAHLISALAGALLPALLPFVVACGAGSLLLRLLDDLRSATASRTRVPLVMTALFSAVGLWAVPLLPLLAHWPLHEDTAVLVMTLASFCWSLAVAALWCVLGGRAGLVRAMLLGVLLSVSGPVAVLLLAGVTSFSATAWEDAGLLGIVMVLSAVACAAALQFAFSARSGATGVAVRRPGVSLFVSVLFGIALTVDAVYTASLAGSFSTLPAMPRNAPAGLQLLLVIGAVATVLAAFLLGYRDRATSDTAAAIATREIRLRKETVQALNDLEQSYRRREAELVARHQLLLDGADVGLWEFDLVTRAAQFSARFAGMLGYSLKEIGPSTSEYLRLVYPDDLPMVLNRIQAHVDGNTPAYVAEFRMRHKDGSYRQIAAHGVAVRDAGGHAVRMAGSHIEVVEKVASAEVAVASSSTATDAPETLRRHGLWESWTPVDHPAAEAAAPQTESTSTPVPATTSTGGTLPSINPDALR
ncbi:PAS domain-containing protein [Ralstonia mojiangensis]|uniref:PAS domain-containing protein n=1 Tax=Ralstonia mojiangensis TaxID=2953895 RepID=UPI0021B24ED2|nr:PAS domain-containing protein [Ralstonia mojiangensis]MCT7326862.1 PAS domain-containing protein [Ralstonia mojiangensis]